jgi:hypothetical protein
MENYNRDWFNKSFINMNFDNLLIEVDNNLVNSNEYYLEYKNKYLTQTRENFEEFKKIIDVFDKLYHNYSIQNNKYTYTYINNKKYEEIKYSLKVLIDNQRHSLDNFLKYIEFLNTSH